MSHLTKAILWLFCALLMLCCCVIDAIQQDWPLLILCSVAFVFDMIDAAIEFFAWTRKERRKVAQKKENKNDT